MQSPIRGKPDEMSYTLSFYVSFINITFNYYLKKILDIMFTIFEEISENQMWQLRNKWKIILLNVSKK